MRLTVVGCSGSFPGPQSPASCYLVEHEHEGRAFRLVVDLGSGALGHLQRHVPLDEVDAIALSHLHPDHFMDLCGMYVARKYDPAGPLPAIPVHGPSNTADRAARAYDLPADPGMSEQFDFVPWSATDTIGPFAVRTARVDHPVEAYAIRIEAGGRTLVYSGDTGPCPALDRLADGADVLLAEASFVASADNPPNLHLTGADAGSCAARAGVARLLLTHVPVWTDADEVADEAARAFSGSSELVSAGAVYDV